MLTDMEDESAERFLTEASNGEFIENWQSVIFPLPIVRH